MNISTSSMLHVDIGVGNVPEEEHSHTTSLQANTHQLKDFHGNSFHPDRYIERKDDLEPAFQDQDSAEVSPTGSRGEVWPTLSHRKRAQEGPGYTSPCRKLGRGLFSNRINPLEEVESFRDTTETSSGDNISEDDIKRSIMRSAEDFEAELNLSLTKMDMLFSTVYVNGVRHEVHATCSEAKEKISKDEVSHLRKKNKQLKAARDRAEKALDHEIATGDKFLKSEFGKELLRKIKNDAVNEFKSRALPKILDALRCMETIS